MTPISGSADAAHTIAAQMPDEITTLIVDDHEVVREGLRLSLSRAPHIRIVGEASDGESAVQLVLRRRPAVVIMDVRMPGMDGLEATRLLSEQAPETKVLIFTAYSERSLLNRGFESGAKGYILKESPHATLVRAIEKVAAGEGYVDPALMPQFLAGRDHGDLLTAREREILTLLADGLSNADVADKPLHLPGDREEPRPPHPHEARSRHADARGRDRSSRGDHRLNESERLDRLITAEQDERRRLALFLHDGPVQELAGIALMVDGALYSIANGRLDEAREIIGAALDRQRETIRQLRNLSFALEPVVLRDHGFAPALRALADQTSSTYELDVKLDLDGAETFGKTAEVALYTIIRELIDQSVRRGPPTRIEITLRRTDDGGVVAMVVDDAEPERRQRTFETVVERVRQLHGELEVVPAPGCGTEIRVSLPAYTTQR